LATTATDAPFAKMTIKLFQDENIFYHQDPSIIKIPRQKISLNWRRPWPIFRLESRIFRRQIILPWTIRLCPIF